MGQTIDRVVTYATKMTAKPSDEEIKQREDEKKMRQIIKRQMRLEKNEIKQSWPFVFGEEPPKQKKDVLLIEHVTLRNVWMEGTLFIFEEIVKFRPNEIFHKVEDYALKWQPPGSPYKIMIPLDDPMLQENVIGLIDKMKKSDKKKVIFFFAPKNPSKPMFSPKVHPSSLISYRAKNAVLKKLCTFYLDGKIRLDELQTIMMCGYDTWKMSMFHLLPADEQIYHKYLLDKPPEKMTDEIRDKLYLDGEITLQEYDELKFPERKKARDIENMKYPQPYDTADCVICNQLNTATIKCPNCENMVCTDCIRKRFLDLETKDGSFVYMHRRFCLKMGPIIKLKPEVALEMPYLRELRGMSRTAAVDRIIVRIREAERAKAKEDFDYDALWGGTDAEVNEKELEEEQLRLMEERAIRQRFEQQKMMKECPPELQAIRDKVAQYSKKLEKVKKDILITQEKLDIGGHSLAFSKRLERMQSDMCVKVRVAISKPLEEEDIREKLLHMVLESETYYLTRREAERLLRTATALSEITSLQSFAEAMEKIEENDQAMIAMEVAAKEARNMIKYTDAVPVEQVPMESSPNKR